LILTLLKIFFLSFLQNKKRILHYIEFFKLNLRNENTNSSKNQIAAQVQPEVSSSSLLIEKPSKMRYILPSSIILTTLFVALVIYSMFKLSIFLGGEDYNALKIKKDVVELGVGMTILIAAAILLAIIKKYKNHNHLKS